MMLFSDVVGLVGVGLTLMAYGLLQFRKLSSSKVTFSAMNAVGSLFILYSLFVTWNLSAVAMELCWLMISLYGVLRSLSGLKS